MLTSNVLADSINPAGDRITTFVLTYPRFIHSELMTHRMFSRNAASSRAVPIETMMAQVQTQPASPTRWGINGKGMQDHGEHKSPHLCSLAWSTASKLATESAGKLKSLGLHKQIVNRVLEPFLFMRTIVTATDAGYENFFALRLHHAAQPEFQQLALTMAQSYLQSVPTSVLWWEDHLPYSDKIPINDLDQYINDGSDDDRDQLIRRICVSRCARVSYFRDDGEIDIESDIALHDRLFVQGHMSPFEHVAKAVRGKHANFDGWMSYRMELLHGQILPSVKATYDKYINAQTLPTPVTIP